MTHQVLARKWRPRAFADIVGQQHVVRALSHALEHQRLHHAYLLTGTRGVGKTTFARILAKCLNCETGTTATPCLQCSHCEAIEQGRFVDLLEIDAASRTRVEDTRELLDNVQYMPTIGRYKIYLIDEVHMLSNHSFNALLKTLEEPPAHVIFILATTDPERLPVTVLSRCLQFQLKSMTPAQISLRLEHILQAEKIAFSLPALSVIAKAATGSMRDALSLLDQVIAFSQSNITEQAVLDLLGGITTDTISHLLQSVINHDGENLLNAIQSLYIDGADFNLAFDTLLEMLHQISVIQIVPAADSDLISGTIRELATQLTKENTQLYYQIALHGKRDTVYAPTPRLAFEMALLRMLAFSPVALIKHEHAKITNENTVIPEKNSTAHIPTASVTKEKIVAPAPSLKPSNEGVTPITCADWAEITKSLNVTGPAKLLANYSILTAFEEDNLTLTLDASQRSMLNSLSQQKLTEALSSYFNRTICVKILVGKSGLPCAANLEKQAKEAWQLSAEKKLTADPGLQLLMQRFEASIDLGSIKPLKNEE